MNICANNRSSVFHCFQLPCPHSHRRAVVTAVAAIALLALGAAIACACLSIAFAAYPLAICGVLAGITSIALYCCSGKKPPAEPTAIVEEEIEVEIPQKKPLYQRILEAEHDDELHEKLFYHKVLGSGKKRVNLDGNTFSCSLASIIEDLTIFVEREHGKDASYQLVLKELNFALSIANSMNHCRLFSNEITDKLSLDVSKRIFEQMELLPEEIEMNPQPAVVIPGGSKNHAVLYLIKRDIEGTYKFTIINTGEGLTEGDDSGRMVDVTYRRISSDVLSELFIGELILHGSKNSMRKINEFLEQYLVCPDRSNIEVGRQHKWQKNEICTMKCLMTFIRNKLNVEEHRRFKTWMIRRAITRFEQYMESSPSRKNKQNSEMLAEAIAMHTNQK